MRKIYYYLTSLIDEYHKVHEAIHSCKNLRDENTLKEDAMDVLLYKHMASGICYKVYRDYNNFIDPNAIVKVITKYQRTQECYDGGFIYTPAQFESNIYGILNGLKFRETFLVLLTRDIYENLSYIDKLLIKWEL